MRTRHGLAMAAVLLSLAPRNVNVKTREIEYRQDGTVLQGFVAWDDAARGKRPGVLVVHEWWGHNEHARNQARRLAEAGYVGFALDMFGKGKVTTHPQEAQAFVSEVTKDPAVLAARFNAALEQLKRDPHVDPRRIAGERLRSEEHTSELQSRGHLVCRLLLEKKKNMKITTTKL